MQKIRTIFQKGKCLSCIHQSNGLPAIKNKRLKKKEKTMIYL